LRTVSELPITSPALISVTEVARVLRRSAATIYALCARGELRASRIGNQLRIAPQDLAAFLYAASRGAYGSPAPLRARPGCPRRSLTLGKEQG
jgi:excisionase family DNA binding protein